jgi:hypothetical protein
MNQQAIPSAPSLRTSPVLGWNTSTCGRRIFWANDPYKALKTTLKAEIHEEAWATLHSDTSRPFDKPASADRGGSDPQTGGIAQIIAEYFAKARRVRRSVDFKAPIYGMRLGEKHNRGS